MANAGQQVCNSCGKLFLEAPVELLIDIELAAFVQVVMPTKQTIIPIFWLCCARCIQGLDDIIFSAGREGGSECKPGNGNSCHPSKLNSN